MLHQYSSIFDAFVVNFLTEEKDML